MSTPHIAWAFKQRGLTHARRLVLIALAERANGDLYCFPSFACIAQDCELSERAVYQAVAYLEHERQPPLIARVTDKQEKRTLLDRAGAHRDTRVNVYRILRPLSEGEKKSNGSQPPIPESGSPSWNPSWLDPEPDSGMNDVHPESDAVGTLNQVQKNPESDSDEPLIESPIESPSVSLRSTPPAHTRGRARGIDPARDALFDHGLVILRDLLPDRSDDQRRSLIGRWRRVAREDCGKVLAALRRAEVVQPAVLEEFIPGILREAPVRVSPSEAAMLGILARMRARQEAEAVIDVEVAA